LGGSGTVGMVITRYLIREFEARVIWIGRRAETDPSIVQKRASLKLFGTPPLYVQADATDPAQLQAAVSRIKTRCPSINGAIFSPVVMNHENTIEKTSEKEFKQVLEVKTQGSINFYAAFKAEPLDFMCYFSSAQAFSFSGAVHFCAYAAGISFSDAFVRSLQGHSKFPVGTINWGFWKSPVKGMSLNKSLVKGILNSTGFLENREGFACFKLFTGLLTRGVLHQALCLRTSESVRKLMDITARETAILAEKHYDPILATLSGIVQPDSDRVLPLLKGIDPGIFYQWITRLLYCQLQALGIFRPDDPPKTMAALGKKAGILDKYGRWFVEAVSILARSGHVRVGNKKIAGAVFPDKDPGRIWEDWDRAKARVLGSSEMKAHMELVVQCVRSLPKILTGKILATDILFPGSSMAVVETIYKKSALSDYFNRLVADMAEAFVNERLKQNPGASIRIIEIGAGTGGTTAVVLPRLAPFKDRVTYLYTDISQSFLLFAQKTYGKEFPFLKYQVWNVEKPPENYGIEIGTYDMVIATNVLHATRNMTKTLDHAKAVLKTNGMILINEVVQNTLMGSLSFGLTDGWWRYEDGHLRIPGSPMVAVPTWKNLLAKSGFREICFPAQSAIQTGQQIIAAQSNGFIRQQVKQAGARQEKMQVSTRVPGQNLAKSLPQKAGTQKTIASVIREELSTALKMPVETIEDGTAFSDYGV
ncbi:MAG: SDR family NAD(P)-dependent oxidoreductase, partial [Proteobacteria bacterium]|nr:SDR family NAD(P)-dependent oxidoreductase [Pseudomonadota bacterium]